MTIDANLTNLNPLAYDNTKKTIDEINIKIAAYKDQKITINRLALLTIASLVVLLAKVAWERFVGIEFGLTSLSSFSIIFGIYNLCIGLVTLGYWIDGKRKAKVIEEAIKKLIEMPTRKFYGRAVEIREDPETSTEVLTHIITTLQSCIEKTKYRQIATYEVKVFGETPETFQCSAVNITDNFNEVKSTVGVWREYYAKLSATPDTHPAILKVVASQCVQDLPPVETEDEAFIYSCTSPQVENLENRKISRKLKGSPKQPIVYQSVDEVRQFLEERPEIIRKFLEDLPKVSITPAPPEHSSSSIDQPPADIRSSASKFVVIDDYVSNQKDKK